eukprot:1177853-Prorocentrum_minimum.AAC.4
MSSSLASPSSAPSAQSSSSSSSPSTEASASAPAEALLSEVWGCGGVGVCDDQSFREAAKASAAQHEYTSGTNASLDNRLFRTGPSPPPYGTQWRRCDARPHPPARA